MRTVRVTLALALLLALPALSFDAPNAGAKPTASPAVSTTSPDVAPALPNFDPSFGAVRLTSCEEQTYADCLWQCYGRAEEGSCSFYASQLCLCQRSWADCPVCY